VELATAVSKDDSSVHKRRNHSFDAENDFAGSISSSSPPKSSLRASPSLGRPTHVAPVEHAPKMPSKVTGAPNSGGLPLKPPSSGRSMSLTGAKPMSVKKSQSSAVPATKIPVTSTPVSASAPASAPVDPFGGMTNRITSLGAPKRKTEVKPKRPPPPAEDDIFASMGLSSKPTFSKPPPSSGNRWNAPASATPSGALLATGSGDEADWDDDDGLDDLLDD